ncbi:hypothetical protein NEMIN01_0669 [Nematocida minor]|uniref:uncharacterized protein n=1 Tax=Nematocida minor TaxID=1912983 RepID=UPI00221EA235|nr:uncharacterized protein NEMIN01_0669 [Nematocida minor]KAI5189716.1 hypothetical protein NEMIN01_0669 [Nematocida minor]
MFAKCLVLLLFVLTSYASYVFISLYQIVKVQMNTKKRTISEKESLRLSDGVVLSVVVHTFIFISFIVSIKHSEYTLPVDTNTLSFLYCCTVSQNIDTINPCVYALLDALGSAFMYSAISTADALTDSIIIRTAVEILVAAFIVKSEVDQKPCSTPILHKSHRVTLTFFPYLLKRLFIHVLRSDSDRYFIKSLFMVENNKDVSKVEHSYAVVTLLQLLHTQKIVERIITAPGIYSS